MKVIYRTLIFIVLLFACFWIYSDKYLEVSNCIPNLDKSKQMMASQPPLFPIVENSKWGFIESTGKVIISPQFDEVKRFSQDRSPFKGTNNGKWGFIDSAGKTIVQPQFDNAFPFVESRAIIQIARRFGFIESNGKTIVEPSFQDVYNFSEERAFVKESLKWRMLDFNGKLDKNIFHTVTSFSEGLAAFSNINNDSKKGFIDPNGRVVVELKRISPDFEGAGFIDGLSLAYVRSPFYWYHFFDPNGWGSKRFGFINKKGAVIIPFKYDVALKFSECLAPVWVKGKAGIINAQGQMVIKPQYDSIGNFSEGLASIQVGKQTSLVQNAEKKWELAPVKYGYVDQTGKVVIKPEFSYGNEFHQGRAAVKTSNGTWGYIDQTGKLVGKAQFDFAFPFRNGLAIVTTKDGWGYVDRQSHFIWFTTEPKPKDLSVFYTLY